MTIYTPGHNEKENGKSALVPEVVLEPLTGFKDDPTEGRETPPVALKVTYFPKHRRPFCFYMFCIIAVMFVIACGITGSIMVYKHMTRKVYTGWCGTEFTDMEYHQKVDEQPQALPVTGAKHENQDKPKLNLDSVREDIEVSEVDMYEELHTPRFNDVRESFILHEFTKNFTAIVDKLSRRCYLMNLDRTAIAPPSDVIDLLKKLISGYYMPQASVMNQNYYTTQISIFDLERFGPRIKDNCRHFSSVWVEKTPLKNDLFDVLEDNIEDMMYAMLSNRMEEPTVFKLRIHIMSRAKRAVDAAPAA